MLARANNPDAEQFLRAATTPQTHRHSAGSHTEEGQARAWLALAHLLENKKPEEALRLTAKLPNLRRRIPNPISLPACCTSGKKNSRTPRPNTNKYWHSTAALHGSRHRPHQPVHEVRPLGEAEPLLRRLAAERPDDAGIHLQLGRVLAAQGKKDDAIAEIQTALKLAPADGDAQRDLADLYAIAGKNDLAEAAYRTLLTAHPNDAELHRGLGKALLLQKKFPEAATGIPGSGPAEARLARCLRRSGLCRQ